MSRTRSAWPTRVWTDEPMEGVQAGLAPFICLSHQVWYTKNWFNKPNQWTVRLKIPSFKVTSKFLDFLFVLWRLNSSFMLCGLSPIRSLTLSHTLESVLESPHVMEKEVSWQRQRHTGVFSSWSSRYTLESMKVPAIQSATSAWPLS